MQPPILLLSPANCGGTRARYLVNPAAEFALAARLRMPGGIAIGEAFAFMSGLYFRGKLAYARAFARGAIAGAPWSGALVIAPGLGLVDVDHAIARDDLLAMAQVPVDLDEPRYRAPLARDAMALARAIAEGDRVVLLGSIATDKYVSVLQEALDGRLLFPRDFVGRGDMSRGGLMLRCAASGHELEYVPVAGAIRHGARPPRLAPMPR
jgi:hypothetical protein